MPLRWRRWGALCAALATTAVLPTAARAQSAPDSVRQLSLDEALSLAEQASDDIAIAHAGVLRARGQQEQARSQFLPQIYGSASYTRTLRSQFQGFTATSDTTSGPPNCSTFVPDTTAPIDQRVRLLEHALGCATSGGNIFGSFSKVGFGAANQYNLGLSVSQNLFAGGRLVAQRREANAARQSAEIALTSAHAQLLLDVAQAYYDAALSDRLLAIARATLAQADTTLAQTRLARQVGNQPEFELLRAQVTRDNQVPVVIQRQSDRDQAYLHLAQLIDLPASQPLALTTGLGDTTVARDGRFASLLDAAPDTSIDQRAPVRQAAENVVAQRSAVTVARAQRIPTLTISSAFGRVAYPESGIPDWGQFRTNWTVTGTISVPLFTGGAIHGQELVAEAGYREAEARQRQTRKLARLDAQNALSKLAAAEAQFAANQGTVAQAVKAYQIAEVRYREGISTQTELSDSRILLQQAQANRAMASRDLQVARLRVALLRDLPLSAGATTGAPSTTPQPVPQLQQPTPGQTSPTQTQAGGAVQASQVGVRP